MKCWASNVSQCCGTQSREHYITQGLFSDKILVVKNAPFLHEKTKNISKSGLTRKCLCKKHNELLSPYDEEAISFGEALEYARDLSYKRRFSKAKRFSLRRKFVCREKLTRWFIKTYLGLHEFFKYPCAVDENELAKLVYSNKKRASQLVPLQIEMGQGENFDIIEEVSIAPIEDEAHTKGMIIEIYGIRLKGNFLMEPTGKNKPLKLKFSERKQGLSCIIEIK